MSLGDCDEKLVPKYTVDDALLLCKEHVGEQFVIGGCRRHISLQQAANIFGCEATSKGYRSAPRDLSLTVPLNDFSGSERARSFTSATQLLPLH